MWQLVLQSKSPETEMKPLQTECPEDEMDLDSGPCELPKAEASPHYSATGKSQDI